MKKGNRSLLIKNLLGILLIIIAVIFLIFSDELSNGFTFGCFFFGITGVYVLLMPVEPFQKIVNLWKNSLK